MNQKNRSPKKKIVLSVWCVFLALVCLLNYFVTSYALSWDKALSGFFGSIGGTEYSVDEIVDLERACALQITAEGIVLLRNEGEALPLSQGSKVSVFGQTAQMWMTKEKLTNTKDTVFLESLEGAGLEVNGELRKFYKQSKHTAWGNGANLGNGGIAGNWAIDEVPQSEYTQAVKDSYSSYSDAAIVVFTRGGSEGGDLPRAMDRFGGQANESYLELNADERDLLSAVSKAGFDRVIVILHTTNALQMDQVDAEQYGVDAVVWVSGTGTDGVTQLGAVLTGAINPSGKTVDTFVYDNFSAPAMQNFGDFRFTQGGQLIQDVTSTVGGTYSYMNYGEGIYVGYKYYETRYEDYVMGTTNVGEYNYAATVAYPFGHGLSYTNFTWSDFKVSAPDSNGNITASVKVTNSGNVAGKEVVEFYYQSPYSDYDQEHGVEKSAVSLIDFGKTAELAPGASEIVEVTVNWNDMASYDAKGVGSYILDAGTYYLTAATDAHQATNNILAAKGYTVDSTGGKMTADGNNAMTFSWTADSLTILNSSSTGYEIVNQFNDCTLPDAVYLSRSDWSVMNNSGLTYADGTMAGQSETTDGDGTVYTKEASAEVYTGLTASGWGASGNPIPIDDSSWPNVVYGQDNNTTLSSLSGADYDSPNWDSLLNQTSQSDQAALVGLAGWGTPEIISIEKPATYAMDGPQGMIDYISGDQGYQFPDENVLGATWNKELAQQMGELCGQEFATKGASDWWSPAINIHRTAFSGRNFEYFGEDGMFSGLMGLEWVKAAQDNDVNCLLKHFFLNDQETNRGANGRLAAFANEQSIREIYLKPFQICIEDGDARGVMLSMGRIGWHIAPGSYNSITNILRNEWGMRGAVITDAQSLSEAEAEQALAAGCDMVCTTQQTSFDSVTLSSPGGQYMLQQGAKNVLYNAANSVGITGVRVDGFPVYILLLIAYNVVVCLYLTYGTVEVLLKLNPEQTILDKKGKRIFRGVFWGLAVAIITVLLFMFFTSWLPALQFAFQTSG